MAYGQQKTERLSIRIGEAERKMLDELSDEEALPISDVVRLLIRRAHTEKFGKKPRPKQ